MSAQAVFDCDDLKNEIFSFCLPQYPVVTKNMINDKLLLDNGKKHLLLLHIKDLGIKYLDVDYCCNTWATSFIPFVIKRMHFFLHNMYIANYPPFCKRLLCYDDDSDEDL